MPYFIDVCVGCLSTEISFYQASLNRLFCKLSFKLLMLNIFLSDYLVVKNIDNHRLNSANQLFNLISPRVESLPAQASLGLWP